MKAALRNNALLAVFLVLAVLLPLAALLFMPASEGESSRLWFWLILLAGLMMLSLALAGASATREEVEEPEARPLFPADQPAVVREIMNVRLATDEGGVQIFRGRLREPGASAFEKLKRTLPGHIVPLVQEDPRFGTAIILLPRPIEQKTLERPVRPWLHLTLFGLTFLTTVWAGAAHQGVNLLREPARFTAGLPYALGLLAILGIHELGHYFAARRHGIQVTPPFFIPVPFGLGTFGAFIQMRSPTENRRALFDVAVAGPLAGLVVAIPALVLGLLSPETRVLASTVVASVPVGEDIAPVRGVGTSAGSSLLFAVLAKLTLPDTLREGCVVQLSPMAFAGWLGVFLTGLNLLPIGQLDGGHLARSMFGTIKGTTISSVAMWSLLLLAYFIWPGFLVMALLIFLLSSSGVTPPLDDVSPLDRKRLCLGYAILVLLVLILAPLPQSLWSAVGIHCPYL